MLRVADGTVRILAVFNWIFMAIFALLLFATLFARSWFLARIVEGIPNVDAGTAIDAIRIVMLLGIGIGAAAAYVFVQLRAILASVRTGDAFEPENGARIRRIAWGLAAVQLLDLGFGAATGYIERALGEPVDWGFALTGWLVVLLLFVLAEVWTQGSAMRDELQGTI